MSFNMKKKYRIKKSDEFQEIINTRKFYRSQSFVIYTKKKQETHARIGISVPKKIGNAVARNKIKRQVRSMVHDFEFDALPFDMVIIVKRGYLSNRFQDNRKDLEKLLKHVKI